MSKESMQKIDPQSWQEWKEACSIERCKSKKTIQQLALFGRLRLDHSLRSISPEIATNYCSPEFGNRAWLKVEQYLYAGAFDKQTKDGKAYKDRLLEGYSDISHFEAILTLKIKQEIARWILSEECFEIRQTKDKETGRKKYVYCRNESLAEELDDLADQNDGIYEEPACESDDEVIEKVAIFQASKLWSSFNNSRKSTQRLLLVCLLNDVWDMNAVLSSGFIKCRKSKLYNDREALFKRLETLDWGSECQTPGENVYMTRRMLPYLKEICEKWLNAAENSELKCFIESIGPENLT
jgi:hypothetical protein